MPSLRHLLLYGPLLWLRKILLFLVGTAIVLGFVIYFAANSPLVIKKAADTFAPDYNISYSRIHGNALTGIEIDDLAYKKESLAKHLTLKWNPNGLLKKEIIVNKLEIEKANVDTIKNLIAFFSVEDVNESTETNSTEPFAFGVTVHHASLTLEPFVEQGILISKAELDAKDVAYASENVSVGSLELAADSNVTDIDLHASLKEGRVNVRELIIEEIDVLALQALFLPDSNETNVTQEDDAVVVTEDNTGKEEPADPLIPQWVTIEKLEISTLPFVYDPVNIKSLTLTGRDAVFDVQKLVLQKANLDLNSSTNLSDILYITKVKDNKLIGKVDFKPKKTLFDLYKLSIRREAVGDIVLDLNVTKEQVVTDLHIQMKQVLKAEKDAFNLDIDNLHSHLVYDIKEGTMKAESKAQITTPYAKDILITNLFTMDDNISYSGEVQAKQLIGVDAKFVKPLNNLQVKYEGDISSIKTDIRSDNLQGSFVSEDFKKAELHLETLKEIKVSELVALPAELNQTKVNVVIDAPLSFEENATLFAYAKIRSNVVNLDANISYRDELQVSTVTHIPKESLLRPYSKELKWDSLNPIRTEAKLTEKGVDVSLKAGTLAAKASYDLNSTKVEGKITLGGLEADIAGVAEEKITVHTKVNAMTSLIESVKSIYTLEDVPVVKGAADLSIVVSELKTADLKLSSPQISYHPDHKTEHLVSDIDFVVSMDASKVVLKSYSLTYEEQKLFSTKPSTIALKDGSVSIEPFWLNDALKIDGKYDTNASKGEIVAQAAKFKVAHELIDLESKIDIKTVLDGNKTSVNGEVIILGGNIHYDLEQRTFASDTDILIVQDMKKKEASPFMDNLSVAVQIKTKTPLIYNKGPVNIKAKADLSLFKGEYADMMLLGTVEIEEGGSYTFEDKRFVLATSYVYFTGDLTKPLLEVKIKYKAPNHRITIMATGAVDAPNINFSSVPSLTKEQILSVILFGSESDSGSSSGEDMMKMMGGAMAKSALSDLGISIDHIAIGAGGSVEVGKKLNDKTTIIYVNDEVSSVKVKYEHSPHLESVLGASEESQSYDIIYKKDF